MPVFMTDPASGHCALFDEAAGGGDFDDINAARNAPLKTPTSNLASLYFHTALDNLEVLSDTTVSISHSLVSGSSSGGISGGSGATSGGGGNQQNDTLRMGATSADHLLLTHSLGYVPDFMVVQGDNTLFGGMPVQTQSDGRGRYATAYATSTAIRLYEWASVSASNLAAISLAYRVIVFRAQRSASGVALIDFDPATGIAKMGKDRFSTDRAYLQVVPGGSPFSLAYGRQMDFDRGAPRFSKPDGTAFDPVPSTQKGKLAATYGSGPAMGVWAGTYGSSMAYAGGYGGATEILVQAP
mgnify:CR=1 FL=1